MVLYRSLEAWPGISRSSGLTKFEGIFWHGEKMSEWSIPLPSLFPPFHPFQVELGPDPSFLVSVYRSGWGGD